MSLKCGIVGLPNVGKSTLFNALTKAGIAAENYPFCTIEPNIGIVEVPDPRLAALAAIAHPEKVIAATVEFVDIAGLVAGASKGEGLGNQFLANIRETDAIAHVVRCFQDDNVIHVPGKIDPVSDIETINTELALADLAAVDKQLAKHAKAAKAGGDKESRRLVAALEKIAVALDQARPARSVDLYPEERAVLKPLFLLTMKPTMYVANVSERGKHQGRGQHAGRDRHIGNGQGEVERVDGNALLVGVLHRQRESDARLSVGRALDPQRFERDSGRLRLSSWLQRPARAWKEREQRQCLHEKSPALGPRHTLNRKCITSPSRTMYSLPSRRILPASLAPCSPLKATKSR